MKKYVVRTKEMIETTIEILKNLDNADIDEFISSCEGWRDEWGEEDLKFILKKIKKDGKYYSPYGTEYTEPDDYVYPQDLIKILQGWVDEKTSLMWEHFNENYGGVILGPSETAFCGSLGIAP